MRETAIIELQELPDQEIWKAMQDDDQQAFTQLVNRHTKALLAYGLQFSQDKDAVKDCIQDLFVSIWTTRHKSAAVVSVRTYLLICLRRKLHKIKNSNSRLTLLGQIAEDSPGMITYSVQDQWIDDHQELERVQNLNALINALPERQKEVLYLKFYQDRSTEQIAEIMDIRYQSVSNLVQRALENIRSKWNSEVDIFMLLALAKLYV